MKEQVIGAWFDRVLATRSYERFDDLHVDQIHPDWKRRDRWIDGAVESLNLAARGRDARRVPFTVAVGFSLLSNAKRTGINARELRDIRRDLDLSPPSLYAFEQGKEPWTNDEDFEAWNGSMFVGDEGPFAAYLREWWDDNDDEYRRSFWLAR